MQYHENEVVIMDVRRIAVSIVAAYIFCLGAAVAVSAEEPAATEPLDVSVADPVDDPAVDPSQEETLEDPQTDLSPDASSEDGSAQDGEQADTVTEDTFVLDEPVDVVVVDVIDDSPVYTVWDKPFNEYSPTEAFTFLLVVFFMLAGMVKFISWAWL